MNTGADSLDRLRDIVEPARVSWWPLAPGWWVSLGLVTIVATLLAFRAWRRWKGNAYRRAALRRVRSATSLPEIMEILKRTALAAFPRSEVASLAGTGWCRWLEETGGKKMPAAVARSLAHGAFQNESSISGEVQSFASYWIRHHHSAAGKPKQDRSATENRPTEDQQPC